MTYDEPGLFQVDVATGMLGAATAHYKKTFADLKGLYADEAAFDAILKDRADEVAYEVTSHKAGDAVSDMILGVTRMQSGMVGNEFFLTRGHIHARANRPEVYYGQKGHGLMQLESPSGDVRIVEVMPQAICYVPPYWIHRSINVGTEDLVMMFAYPADSGQDYGIIERSNGMKVRIVGDGKGGWKEEANPDYLPRSAETVESILQEAARSA